MTTPDNSEMPATDSGQRTRVLCEAHTGAHTETDSCQWPHEIAPEGHTWADGRYGS
jgi:hypothetical protein